MEILATQVAELTLELHRLKSDEFKVGSVAISQFFRMICRIFYNLMNLNDALKELKLSHCNSISYRYFIIITNGYYVLYGK